MDYKNIVKEILSNFESTEVLDGRLLKGIALMGKMRSECLVYFIFKDYQQMRL